MINGDIPGTVNSVKWQGYRGGDAGVIVYYESDPNSELPIRKVPVKESQSAFFDPNYETKTFGLYGCGATNLRNKFVKKKWGYVFFITKYKGTIEEFEDKLIMTGYYRIDRTADVQKLHLRHLDEYSCFDARNCHALRADEAVFLKTEDSYNLTTTSLKSFGHDKKVTKMTKIEITDEMVKKILKKFTGKENAIEEYCDLTQELLANRK